MKINKILHQLILWILLCCQIQANSPLASVDSTISPKSVTGRTVSDISFGIWSVYQDKKGTYWFGSLQEGVYRYDGKTVAHFTKQDGLCNDSIRNIQEDKSGNLYFETVAGISRYDGQSLKTLGVTSSDSTESRWQLTPDDLWFRGAQDSAVVYRYDGKNLHRLKFTETREGDEHLSRFPRSQFPDVRSSPYDVYSIYRDSKGNMWFGTGSLGVCRYDGRSHTWISERDMEYGDIAFGVRAIAEDTNGKFWFSNIKNKYAVTLHDTTASRHSFVSIVKEPGIRQSKDYDLDAFTYVMSTAVDKNGELWMVTYGAGVWRFDGTHMTHYDIRNGNDIVTLCTIYRDKHGVFWLGTHENGAYRYNGKAFDRFRP